MSGRKRKVVDSMTPSEFSFVLYVRGFYADENDPRSWQRWAFLQNPRQPPVQDLSSSNQELHHERRAATATRGKSTKLIYVFRRGQSASLDPLLKRLFDSLLIN